MLLLACKEEHVFCGPFLALGLWLNGQRRTASFAAALTLLWGAFVFVGRPLLWGPSVPYLHDLLTELWRAPAEALLASLRAPAAKRLGTLLAPFALIFGWVALRRRRAISWPLALATLPLLASRFIAVKWAYQYGPPLVGLWVAACLPALASARLPRWVALGTIVLLATSAENQLRSAFSQWRPSSPPSCSANPERLKSLERGLAFLREHPQDAALVGSTLVAPLAGRSEIYCFASSRRLSQLRYRYLLVEPHGYPWPLTAEESSRALDEALSREGTRIVLRDEYVLLAEGDF